MNGIDSEYPLGRRIAVNGKGGKTTLSKALAKKFDLEFIEQDAIRHQANWVELPIDEHLKVLDERFANATDGWVSDGNYQAVNDTVLSQVDTVIILALPLRVMMWRTFKRTLRRALTRSELWNGNKESTWEAFFTKRSVIWDVWIRRERYRSYRGKWAEGIPDSVNIVMLRSGRELNEFYKKYGLVRE